MGRDRSTRRSLRRIRTMTALLLLALVVSGCTSANGGGWLPSRAATDLDSILTDPSLRDAKANFGFNGKCVETQMEVDGRVQQVAALSGGDESQSGQFQYDDHAYLHPHPSTSVEHPVKFHGDVTGGESLAFLPPFNTCQEVQELGSGDFAGMALLVGTYRPQDRTLAKECGATRKGPNPCTFEAIVEDTGEPGFQGDIFNIEVTGGPFTGYFNQGPIQGGNIQVD